ncbi:DNA polymerase delta, subunit 4-domain-containing protein [Limtongia smithiae]|uniref:DNA polymerase delta, subunit 4-domain-containing protein n=1 Tax=Limtongia smithiae TaxID=1125753 RepID=UPI0034CE5D7A
MPPKKRAAPTQPRAQAQLTDQFRRTKKPASEARAPSTHDSAGDTAPATANKKVELPTTITTPRHVDLLSAVEREVPSREAAQLQSSLSRRKSSGVAPSASDDEEGSAPPLDPKDPKYAKFLDAQLADSISAPIHQDDSDIILHILKNFDLTASYGPTAGLSRLDRWKRADKLGLAPPIEVYEILASAEGKKEEIFREGYLYGQI